MTIKTIPDAPRTVYTRTDWLDLFTMQEKAAFVTKCFQGDATCLVVRLYLDCMSGPVTLNDDRVKTMLQALASAGVIAPARVAELST